MKSLKIWSLMLLLAMAVVGCDNDGDGDAIIPAEMVGKWHIESWCGGEPEFDVYLEFSKNGTFNIYQQTWKFTYQHFTGVCSAKNGVLSGVYSDGSSWIANYEYSVANSKLTLTNTLDSYETSTYAACTIPAEVIREATTTRCEDVTPFL